MPYVRVSFCYFLLGSQTASQWFKRKEKKFLPNQWNFKDALQVAIFPVKIKGGGGKQWIFIVLIHCCFYATSSFFLFFTAMTTLNCNPQGNSNHVWCNLVSHTNRYLIRVDKAAPLALSPRPCTLEREWLEIYTRRSRMCIPNIHSVFENRSSPEAQHHFPPTLHTYWCQDETEDCVIDKI